jgi:hypothetical protein
MTPKRSLSVSIKMSEEDLSLFMKAAAQIWPKAVLSRSGIILGLARIEAESVITHPKHK